MAVTDALTGLYNRRYMETHLSHLVEHSINRGKPLSALAIDVDFFKTPLDVAAIADAVERMSWLAHDLGSRLVDLEVNPLIVRRDAGGAVAVDGRAIFKEEK